MSEIAVLFVGFDAATVTQRLVWMRFVQDVTNRRGELPVVFARPVDTAEVEAALQELDTIQPPLGVFVLAANVDSARAVRHRWNDFSRIPASAVAHLSPSGEVDSFSTPRPMAGPGATPADRSFWAAVQVVFGHFEELGNAVYLEIVAPPDRLRALFSVADTADPDDASSAMADIILAISEVHAALGGAGMQIENTGELVVARELELAR